MKNKILIHSIAFSPDGVSTAYLYNDIALRFRDEGYDVVVMTTTPHYNALPAELARQPLKKRLLGLFYESCFKNIRVLHVPQKKFKSSFLRILGFVYWHFLSLFLGLAQKNISIILSPSPPLTIGLINLLIARIKGAKTVYNVQEIYPDFLINQGKLKLKPIILLLQWIEKIVYNRSDAVTTIDEVFYETIVDRFNDKSKLNIIPNFVDSGLYRPLTPSQTDLDPLLFPVSTTSLKLMYAGNIGHAQAWEPFLEIAKSLADKDVEFWIIGEGVMKPHLEQQKKIFNLKNVHLVPYQSRDLMPSLIAYADLHFIFMSPEMEGQGFPSKVYTLMACAKPLVIISGEGTPIVHFLKSLRCAFIVTERILEEQRKRVEAIIMDLLNDESPLKSMGEQGLDCIEKNYSKHVVTMRYVSLANKLLNN